MQDMLSAGVAQASLFGRSEINLDSQAQVTDALLGLGVPVPNTTRAWELQPLAEQYPVIAKLLEYRGVAKAISSASARIYSNLSSRRPAGFTPIFDRSELRPDVSRAQSQTSNRYPTKKNIDGVSELLKGENS